MSLIRQLWIGIIVLLLLALGGSFAISLLSAKNYFEQQLRLKNIDNATTLALSMSQLAKDPVTLELMITAQFDAGHYEYIMFNDPHNKPIVARNFAEATAANVPGWFNQWVAFNLPPGIAQVQDGWQQYGTLLVKSHSGYAVEALWHNAKNLLEWFLFACVVAGLLGSLVLKYLLKPLDAVIAQAEAIGAQRFIVSREPKTLEFRRLVHAMNHLSGRVQTMLNKEVQQLQQLRREAQQDKLTGLSNREHFFNILDTRLQANDGQSQGVLALVRVRGLGELNKQLGHQQTDALLCQLANAITHFASRYPDAAAGRLNGSDLALLMPGNLSPESIAAELSHGLNLELVTLGQEQLALPLAACRYQQSELRAALMQRLDGALAQAELKGNRAVVLANRDAGGQRHLEDWRNLLQQALNLGHLSLEQFPVRDLRGELIHQEAPLRLALEGELKPASFFMPWASRLGLLAQLDLTVLRLALTYLQQPLTTSGLAINISADALCNARFREQAIEMIEQHPEQAQRLWLDFPEVCALRHMDELRAFCTQLHQLGCHPGLKHVGLEFTQFQQLQDMGLSHLKIDSALVQTLEQQPGNQAFLQSLCHIGHSLGFTIVAMGVNRQEQQSQLEKLGLDGFTGPGIH